MILIYFNPQIKNRKGEEDELTKQLKDLEISTVTIGSMDIEVECFVYGTYIEAFANYYYAGEESITGKGVARTRRLAIKRAILHLFDQRVRERKK